MRFSLTTGICLTFAIFSTVVADDKTPAPNSLATRPADTQPAAPINRFCAVETENPVDPDVPTVTYQGKVIGFCCEDCIPTFKKDPAKYMKNLK